MHRRLLPLVLALLFAACGEVEDTHPGQPVKQRQQAFKALLRSFEPIGQLLKDKRFDADRLSTLGAAFAEQRQAPWSHFGPETNYPPSKSTPEVWRQPEQFAQAREDFLKMSDDLLAAIGRRDRAEITAAHARVVESCQSCHRTFRQR